MSLRLFNFMSLSLCVFTPLRFSQRLFTSAFASIHFSSSLLLLWISAFPRLWEPTYLGLNTSTSSVLLLSAFLFFWFSMSRPFHVSRSLRVVRFFLFDSESLSPRVRVWQSESASPSARVRIGETESKSTGRESKSENRGPRFQVREFEFESPSLRE